MKREITTISFTLISLNSFVFKIPNIIEGKSIILIRSGL